MPGYATSTMTASGGVPAYFSLKEGGREYTVIGSVDPHEVEKLSIDRRSVLRRAFAQPPLHPADNLGGCGKRIIITAQNKHLTRRINRGCCAFAPSNEMSKIINKAMPRKTSACLTSGP